MPSRPYTASPSASNREKLSGFSARTVQAKPPRSNLSPGSCPPLAAASRSPAFICRNSIWKPPSSGLDVAGSVLIKDLLAALAAQGRTVLYSSHVLDVVEKVCNRALIIDRGNLIADAPLEELKSSTMESSLEGIFQKLTRSEDTKPKVERVLEILPLSA